MEEVATTNTPIAWPWQPDDVLLTPADFRMIPQPWWQKQLFHRALIWLLCGILCVTLAGFIEQQMYQHAINVQHQWIVQQSQVQTQCLQHAQTTAQRSACGYALAQAVAQQESIFSQQWTPPGDANTSATMQSAFNALYAAACYSDTSQTVDMTCLHTLAPRLRELALLDAAAAQHG